MVEKVEIKADTIGDENMVVTCLCSARIADASAVADADKAIHSILRRFVGTDAIITAFDGLNVFKDAVAAVAMDVEAIVVRMGHSKVLDDEVGIVTTELHSSTTDRIADVSIGEFLSCLDFEEKAAKGLLWLCIQAGRAFDEGPLSGLQFLRLFIGRTSTFRGTFHELHLAVE